MGKLKNFYYGSPSVPGSLIKNMIYKILWRLSLVNSPSMGDYETYIKNRKSWRESSNIFEDRQY